MNIYGPLEATFQIPQVLQAAVLAIGILMLGGLLIRRQIAAAGGGVMPDDGVTLRNFVEVVIEALANVARDVMGDEWRRYFPIVGAIFVFILVSNLLGLVPGLGGATSNTNTTTAWAIIAFGTYNYVGIRKHGFGYIKQFMGPVLREVKLGGKTYHVRALFWFFIPLEIFLHLARIGTLSLRLLANMFADHTLVAVWIVLLPIAVPAVFMALGTLVAILQAGVFSLLTMIYISLALGDAH